MVVISFCASWHSVLHAHDSAHSDLPWGPCTSLLGEREPVQTPAYLNTKHHSSVEIIKQALALKLQTRDHTSVSGAHWNESLESLDSTDAWHSLEVANGGEEHSRNSRGALQCLCRPAVAVEFSAAVPPVSSLCFPKPLPLFCDRVVTDRHPQTTELSSDSSSRACQGWRIYVQAPQPLKCWEGDWTIQTLWCYDIPSSVDLSKQMLHSRNKMIISKFFM